MKEGNTVVTEFHAEEMTLRLLLDDFDPPIDSLAATCLYKDKLILQRSNILVHIIFRLLQKQIPYHEKVLSRILGLKASAEKSLQTKSKGSPRFLVRVDDFPRWDLDNKKFLKFNEILRRNEIPYLLGVIPFPSKEPLNIQPQEYHEIGENDWNILKDLSSSDVEIAMHGVTHQTMKKFRHSEIVGVSQEDLEEKVVKGLKKFRSNGIEPVVFIPPFNTFDFSSLEVLKRYFRVVCGGPESILYVGLMLSPSYIDQILYVPSYYPAYGRSGEVFEFVERVKKIKTGVTIPITLHWAWENHNDFLNVEKLCRSVRDHVISWNSFYSCSHQQHLN